MSAIETQKRLEIASRHGDVDALRALIHDDCVVASVSIGEAETICGRDAVVREIVARASNDWVFRLTIDRCRELDPETLLITGAVRRRAGQRGHAMSSVAWLNRFAEEALISSRTFPCEVLALGVYARTGR